ncbi:MAG: NADH-quinone oxidoreductase subunit NuoB [Methylacidiphilaceae bacterium]|nr:NADH-quinone oxidoreductase subunit NuoB [Candidatus Methylacidiphilaceae bacterium]
MTSDPSRASSSPRPRRPTLFGLIGSDLTEPPPPVEEAIVRDLCLRVEEGARYRLGRSLALRLVDAGSCNGCELELHALQNPFYDLERFGLRFVASPRHADVLLVSGTVTRNMREALERTYHAIPDPKWVVAVGDCAVTGGLFSESYACVGPARAVVPVDLTIPGCPPRPQALLAGLLALLESMGKARRA